MVVLQWPVAHEKLRGCLIRRADEAAPTVATQDLGEKNKVTLLVCKVKFSFKGIVKTRHCQVNSLIDTIDEKAHCFRNKNKTHQKYNFMIQYSAI